MRRSAVAALLLALAGCTSQVTGEALPDPRYTPPPPEPADRAADLLGDFGTLDPCSLLPEGALARFGSTEKPNQDSFDDCWLTLPVAGAKVAVRFGSLEGIRSIADLSAKHAKEVKAAGPLRVFEETPTPDRCARYIVFSDNVTMTVAADTYDTPDAEVTALCAITERATSAVAEQVADRKVEHRRGGTSSLGGLDACESATNASLSAVPGLAVSQITEYPAGHQCRWGSPTVPSVSVRYAQGLPFAGPDTKQEPIAGRITQLYTVDLSDRSLCIGEIKPTGAGEVAQVFVRLPKGGVEQACAGVRAIAAEVWPKLPG